MLNRPGNPATYFGQPLRVLSLWQPWATLCVAPDPDHGGKPAKVHETRHFAPRLALPFSVAIHATKTWNAEVRAAFEDVRFRSALARCGFYPGDPRKVVGSVRGVPLGAIVGIARVVCVDATLVSAGDYDIVNKGDHSDDYTFGNFQDGRFAWRLADTLMLREPIPFSGRQDVLYPLPPAVAAAIDLQLRAIDGRPYSVEKADERALDGDPSRVVFSQEAL